MTTELAALEKCIISEMSSNFGQIRPQTIELAVIECLKYLYRFIMGNITCWLSGEQSLPFGLLVVISQ